jgi:hypothetical protein
MFAPLLASGYNGAANWLAVLAADRFQWINALKLL